jgi:hypothetical protein
MSKKVYKEILEVMKKRESDVDPSRRRTQNV